MKPLNVHIEKGSKRGEKAIAIEVINGNFLCILKDGNILQISISSCQALQFLDSTDDIPKQDSTELIMKHFEEKISSIIKSISISNNRLNDLANMHQTLTKSFSRSSLQFSKDISSLELVKKMHTERIRILEVKNEIPGDNKNAKKKSKKDNSKGID